MTTSHTIMFVSRLPEANLLTNSSDNFTNLFLSLSSWKRKQTPYLLKKGVFFQFASWNRNHNKYLLKKIVDSEFEIGEIIWWTTPVSFRIKNHGGNCRFVTVKDNTFFAVKNAVRIGLTMGSFIYYVSTFLSPQHFHEFLTIFF